MRRLICMVLRQGSAARTVRHLSVATMLTARFFYATIQSQSQVLLKASRYDAVKELHRLTDTEMADAKLLRIHPSFRMVAMGEETLEGGLCFHLSSKGDILFWSLARGIELHGICTPWMWVWQWCSAFPSGGW